jgi:ornithine cyclodeaminase/alanine dehydrogenase-like protein (mu-crystallin family)
MPIILKADDLAPMLDMPKAIELTEQVLQELSRGNAKVHAPYHLGVPNGAIRVVSAALQETGTVGLRYGPALNLTPPSGYRNHLCSLYRLDGELLAILGYPFSQLRTGATVGAAIKHLSKPGSVKVAMIGTGMNALSLIDGVKAVRDVTQVSIFSRDAERRKKFADEAAKSTGLNVQAAASMEDAVGDKDIVLTATNFRQPLFESSILQKDCMLASMGPIGEIAESLFLSANHIVVSCQQQERDYFMPQKPFPLVDLINAGKLSWNDVDELGSVISGQPKDRKAPGGLVVFHESAGGFGDTAFATYAYNEAIKKGLGTQVQF